MPVFTRSGSTCFRRFKRWRAAGVFAMAHVEMLIYYDDKVGIDWDWASLDSASVKAPKRTNSWHNNFRGLRIRWERTAENHLAFVQLACALICFQAANR